MSSREWGLLGKCCFFLVTLRWGDISSWLSHAFLSGCVDLHSLKLTFFCSPRKQLWVLSTARLWWLRELANAGTRIWVNCPVAEVACGCCGLVSSFCFAPLVRTVSWTLPLLPLFLCCLAFPLHSPLLFCCLIIFLLALLGICSCKMLFLDCLFWALGLWLWFWLFCKLRTEDQRGDKWNVHTGWPQNLPEMQISDRRLELSWKRNRRPYSSYQPSHWSWESEGQDWGSVVQRQLLRI